jgi:cobalt transporter subunit CbtA
VQLFRRIVFAAALAGLLGGVVVTALQALGAIPLILQAETYEAAAQSAHTHDEEAWAPADGAERTLLTLLANSLTGIGLGLLVTAVLALWGRAGWRSGLLLGAGGFIAFTLAPAMGLPPELPGAAHADLADRQVWWVLTVVATAGGLALLAWIRRPWAAVAAVALIVLPHLVGAPQPANDVAAAPEDLVRQFVWVAVLTSFAFWLVLGSAAGFFYERFASKPA